MGKKLSKAPVYYTVAQVQFNPILNLDGYMSAIQTKLREAHFPDFKQEIVQRLVLPLGWEAGQAAAPTVTPQFRYQFGDISGRSVFFLEPNSLSFQTTAYETFDDFSASMMRGLSILHEVIGLDFYERIGIRYLDAVLPQKDTEHLQDYLVPEVLGHAFKLKGQFQQAVSETVTINEAGQLISRVIIRNNGHVGLPMELAPHAPNIAPRFIQQEGLHAIIDTDAFYAQREVFDLGAIKSRLASLHAVVTSSFKATITTHAEAAWA